MKCSIFIVIALILICLLGLSKGKKYTIKGQPQWPTDEQIKAFVGSLSGKVSTDSDENYKAPYTYNLRTGPPQPSFVVKVTHEDDIVTALEFARKHELRITIRSTGHHQDARNTADQSLMLDMSGMNQKSIDIAGKTLTVGPGNCWSDIFKYLKQQSEGKLVVVSGSEPGVGPAGWVLGGGHGRLSRMHGLGVDNLLGVTVVLANGTKATVSETSHPRLFRALRGSGGSAFAVITSLTFKLHDDPGLTTEFNGAFLATPEVANAYQQWMKSAPNNANGYYITGYDFKTYKVNYVSISAMCFGPRDECKNVLAPLSAISGCTGACTTKEYSSMNAFLEHVWDNRDSGGYSLYLVSGALDLSVDDQLAKVTAFQTGYNPDEWTNAVLSCYCNSVFGGASKQMDPFKNLTVVGSGMRNSLIGVSCGAAWQQGVARPDIVAKMDKWADTTLKSISTNSWVYWNEPQHNFANNDWQTRYWDVGTYDFLKTVKKEYDVDNVFTCYHCVGWDEVENIDPAVCPNFC